jgi:NADH-quinone oxidoreductase subunit N
MKDVVLLLPEIFLAVTVAGIVISEVGYHGERTRLLTATALVGLAGALVQTLLTYEAGATLALDGTLAIDGFSLFFKLFFVLLATLAVLTSLDGREIGEERRAEYCALVIAAALAMCFAAASADLLLAFLSLQAMNVIGYFLAAYGKREARSTEAAVKHLAFGAISGAFFLYGAAILYASTHSLNIYEMHKALTASPLPDSTALVVFMLMFLSFAFQFGAFPMHLWTPDVLEGAPTPVSAFLSVGTRAAGFAFALRFLIIVFAQPALAPGQWQVLGEVDWPGVVALVAGLTMAIGALLAYRQEGSKRLVAYLVVAQTGFLLLGLLVLDEVGIAALLYNLVVELFALMGAYHVLSTFQDEIGSDRLEDLKGLLGRAVPECIGLVLFLTCLVGVPPLPGFLGKFTLVGVAIRHEWYFLAALAIGASTLGMVAVARLAYSLVGEFRRPAVAAPIVPAPARRIVLGALFVPLVLVGVFAELVLGWAGQSLRFILW